MSFIDNDIVAARKKAEKTYNGLNLLAIALSMGILVGTGFGVFHSKEMYNQIMAKKAITKHEERLSEHYQSRNREAESALKAKFAKLEGREDVFDSNELATLANQAGYDGMNC